jgi:molybdenum cofactor synthesis domain-containing protein
MSDIVTAAMIVIGDEILSGRTKDRNIGHLADIMTAVGVDLKEVRIVPDEEDEIVAAVNALRHRYDYVFTTGGIGPTHDDITADAVAKAFGVPCDYDAKAMALLAESYARRNIEFNDARKRMARMPEGAAHIDNPVSTAPGFRIGNVHVMAGVPSIFQAMLDNVVPTLKTGTKCFPRPSPARMAKAS